MAKKKTEKVEEQSSNELEAFETQFKQHLVPLSNIRRKHSDLISTGSLRIDGLLNGGLVRGTISEFMGPPGSGKSTLAMATAAQVLKSGGKVIYFDLENGLDGGVEYENGTNKRGWLQVNGVDPDHKFFKIYSPTYGEEVYEMLETVITKGVFDLAIVDSMASLVTRAEMDGKIGESHYGQVAKLNSQALKRLMVKFKENPGKTHVNVINQVRDNINSPHGGFKSTGGNALPHYVGCKLKFVRIAGSPAESSEVFTTVRVESQKSRYSRAGRVNIQISADYGIDLLHELLDYGIVNGVIEKSGAWFQFPQEGVKVQGAKSAKEYIRSSGLEPRLFEQAKASLFSNTETDEEYSDE